MFRTPTELQLDSAPPKPTRLAVGIACVLILLIVPHFLSQAQAATSPVTAVLTGLNFPVSLKFAPDGRIFYTEKDTGSIRIILQNRTLLTTPFATVSPIFTDGEAGLLGIALDPSFSSNGYVYVYYTDRDPQNYTHGHIRRYTATGNTGADPVSIFNVTSAAPNTIYHNGGYIKFGPDGKLYAQVGEFHQSSQAQNQGTMDGKMLRMNPDGSVPSDNPFPVSLVWALGIRNAFGFDFDSSNGRLIATEAGPTSDDEINVIVKGGNYGWPKCTGPCSPHNPAFIDPIVDFNPVVTPTGIAAAEPNVYYFGEWNTGNLVRLNLTSTGSVISMTQVYTQSGGIIAVEMGPNSKLYYSSPDGIYSVNTQFPIPELSFLPSLVFIAIGAVGAIAAATTAVYLQVRRRRKRSTISLPQENAANSAAVLSLDG
jgi:glucose/arabinose dehydrogenase